MKLRNQLYIKKLLVPFVWLFISCNCCYAGQLELLGRYQALQKESANLSTEEQKELVSEMIKDFEKEFDSNISQPSSFFLVSLGKLYKEAGRISDSLEIFETVAKDKLCPPSDRLRAANLAVSASLHCNDIDHATRIIDGFEELIKSFKDTHIAYDSIYDKLYLVLDHKRARFLENYGVSLANGLKAAGKHQEAEARRNDYRIQANNILKRYIDTTLKSPEAQHQLEWLQSMNWDEAATLYKSAHLHSESARYYSSIGGYQKADFYNKTVLRELEVFFDKCPQNPKFSQANAVLLLKTKEPSFKDESEFFEYAKQLETNVSGPGIAFSVHLYEIGNKFSAKQKYIISNNFILLAKELFEEKYPNTLTTDLLYCNMLLSLGYNYTKLYDVMSLGDILNCIEHYEFTSSENVVAYAKLKKAFESQSLIYLEDLEEQDTDIKPSINVVPLSRPSPEPNKFSHSPVVKQEIDQSIAVEKDKSMNMIFIIVFIMTFGVIIGVLLRRRKHV